MAIFVSIIHWPPLPVTIGLLVLALIVLPVWTYRMGWIRGWREGLIEGSRAVRGNK